MTTSILSPEQPKAARWIWAGLLIVGSIVLSTKFSCATPFAALAALAALDMKRSDGLLLVVAVWAANQAVGYGLLGYPIETQSFTWGATIGVAAVAGYFAARGAIAATAPQSFVAAIGAALIAAFVVYQAVLFAATAILPSGETAFSLPVIGEIALVNAIAFTVLLLLHRLVAMSGMLPQISRERLAA